MLASDTKVLREVNSLYVAIMGQMHQYNLAATVQSTTVITVDNLLFLPC